MKYNVAIKKLQSENHVPLTRNYFSFYNNFMFDYLFFDLDGTLIDTEKIYVKVLRQNDTYSIVENYTDDELKELGFDIEYINKRQELNVYDEILLY